MNARGEQRFIGVNIPNAGNECLIEQQRLDEARMTFQSG